MGNAALVRRERLDQHADHTSRHVELPALLPFRTGELREEVFVEATQDVLRADLGIVEFDRADQFAEPLLVESRTSLLFRQHSLEPWIDTFDRDHRLVD